MRGHPDSILVTKLMVIKLGFAKIVRIFAIAQIAVVTNYAPVWAGEADELALPKVVVGQGIEACRAVAKIVRATKNEDFWIGRWREGFGSVEWMGDSFPTITAEGRHADVPFLYTTLDINNDGRRDIVVLYSTLFSSIMWDWLYLFRPAQFRVAQKKGSVGKLFEQVPSLNPRNFVQFSNGQSGWPVELHLWHYKGRNFILLKEHSFAKGALSTPGSFFVAKLNPQSAKWDKKLKVNHLVPELICRLVAE